MGQKKRRKQQADRPSKQQKTSTEATTLSRKTEALVPLYTKYTGPEKYLTPNHAHYEELMSTSYQGFVHETRSQVSSKFHKSAKSIFEQLRDRGYFQYDVVMAGGKHLSRTFVRRTLVGEYGITYKYLGLRIFAHSWGPKGVNPLFRSIYHMNQEMIQRTKKAMKQCTNPQGSCNYNLTLINYMEPIQTKSLGLKEDTQYGMGKVSVSWHADSALQDFSTIGVYHCLPTLRKCDWNIALRVAPDVPNADKTPPVCIPTENGDTYYLTGDFNHQHQHMVIAGTCTRVSSTHRVAVVKEDTLDYIMNKVRLILKSKVFTPQQIRQEQQVLTEVEMEWIRQYWVQGKQHNELHVDWQKPMARLEAYWELLERRTALQYEACITQQPTGTEAKKLMKVLITEMTKRTELRRKWDNRLKDRVYKRIAPEFQPIERPLCVTHLPKYLTKHVETLRELLTKLN